MLNTFRLACLAFILISASLMPGLSSGAIITPDLRQALESAGPDGNVPVIINLADKADLAGINVGASNKTIRQDKASSKAAIVRALKDKADQTQVPLRTLLKSRGAKKMTPFWITNSIAATIPAAVVGELMSLPEVESITFDAVVQAPPLVPAAFSTPIWNISRIKAPDLWNAGITGSGVVVANLDTGVDVTHPDLQAAWRGGACTWPPYCDSWYDPYPRPPVPPDADPSYSTEPHDNAGSSTGHGTGTMGIMVGASAASAYGVAPAAQWIGAKIFSDSGTASTSIIIGALQWILCPGCDPAAAGCVCAPSPDVVNNSWGEPAAGCSYDPALDTAIQNVMAAGIAVVFSAGNSGPAPSTSISPANYPGIFAAGATDSSDLIASFSSRGPSACDDSKFPHVVAPGVGIYTSAPAGAYHSVDGTSFSAPHVAGAMALLLSAFPTLTPATMKTVLEQAALHLTALPPDDAVPNNVYGYGLIDVSGALSFIVGHGNISIPELTGYPASFDYGSVGISSTAWQTFTLTNNSGGGLTINSVSMTGTDAAEFSITGDTCTGITLAPSGNCSFTVSVVPVTTGPKSAAINISHSDPAVVYGVPLTCIVVGPVARVHGSAVVATYSSIQTAYSECASGDVIRLQEITFPPDTNLNALSDISVGLEGGFDQTFGAQIGMTTVSGTLTISRGTVTIGDVILQ